MMNRRVFLAGLGTVLATPHAAAPQEAKKLARVGYLAAVSAAADAPRADAFRQGLRDLGYIEGRTSMFCTGMRRARLSVFPSWRRSCCA